MDLETRQPDTTSRLRLVDIQVHGAHLHLGGELTAVLTTRDARTRVARSIAGTVAGPRGANADAVVELAGEMVPVGNLPATLLPPGGPSVLLDDDIRAQWQAAYRVRRDQLAALHAARRLERHRLEAAIERAAAPVPSSGTARDRETDVGLDAFKAAAQAYVRVETLLPIIEALEPQPSPDALRFADLLDANGALLRERDEVGDDPDIDIDAAERRVNFARVAVRLTSAPLHAARRGELERRHRAVAEAETALAKARRRDRPDLLARYEAAVAAERAALDEAGVDSYAMLLLGTAFGETRTDEAAQHAAQQELAAALKALEAARLTRHLPSRAELQARALELRSRAIEILGRFPTKDVAADLRAFRVEPPQRAERIRDLVDALASAGIDAGDDPVAVARRFLTTPPSLTRARPRRAPEPPIRTDLVGTEKLERQLVELERHLEALQAEIDRLDATRYAELSMLEPDDLVRAVGCLLDSYRAGEVLAGRLPLVLDGVFDALTPGVRRAGLEELARATDLQAIVVTGEPLVADAVSEAGGRVVEWPEARPDPAAADASIRVM